MSKLRVMLVLLLLVAGQVWVASVQATTPRLVAVPPEVDLNDRNRRQFISVTAIDQDGSQRDVTDDCEYLLEDPGIARLNELVLSPRSSGQTRLVVRHASGELAIPVKVQLSDGLPAVDFQNEIMPLFSKYRCNGSGCHGKQEGQNGFKLSVFGFDPDTDYSALKQEARGRRLFIASPRQSLLFTKALGILPHGGGRRIEQDSPDAELLLAWIAQGAPRRQPDAPRLERIVVEPQQRLLSMESQQRLVVTAVYSDGSRRDVTSAAAYTCNTPSVAEVSGAGLVRTGKHPGEAAITVNFMSQVGLFRATVPRLDTESNQIELEIQNEIDQFVLDKLRNLGIRPAPVVDDATFLRRLHLDLLGTLPRASEVREFLSDPRPDRRSRWVEAAFKRPEFADFWALKWADILLVNSESLGQRGAYEFHGWLRKQIASNRPYDQWVREIITASGNTGREGPANFFRGLKTSPDVTKTVSQAFLGIRLDCAQCHHHPFERWGQDDFYGMAGYFTNLQRKSLGADRELIFHGGHEPARSPVTGEAVVTRALDGQPYESDGTDPRRHLASWLTSRENPWFARLVANRIWKHFLGRGIVEPEDDFRETNPPTNPQLLDYLAAEVAESGYDLQHLIRLIVNSNVYQLSADTNESNVDDEQFFSHHLLRRMPAEVLLDAIATATGVAEEYPGLPAGTRAISLWDNRLPSYFLDTFGRSERESPCECARSSEPTMAQALHLMNAPEIMDKLADPEGRAAQLVRSEASREQIVETLCLVTLGRPAEEREYQIAEKLFRDAPPQEATEDFLWSLMNSYEFLFH